MSDDKKPKATPRKSRAKAATAAASTDQDIQVAADMAVSDTAVADTASASTDQTSADQTDADTLGAEPVADRVETIVELPSEAEVESLLKSYVIGSMTVALVPVPAFDAAAIIALQVKMVHSMTKMYEVPFSEKLAQRLLISLIGGVAPVAAAMAGASLLKSVPLLGTVSGTASMVVLAGASTYASGKVLAYHLDNGGDLSNVDMSAMRKGFKEQFAKGKDVARNAMGRAKDLAARKGASPDTTAATPDVGTAQPA